MLTTTLAITERTTNVLVMVGVLLLAILILIVLIALARKILFDTSTRLELDGFSISELQELLADGKITQEEFNRAKASVIAVNRRKLDEQDTSEK